MFEQGQSISHIYKTHDINCSRSTLYKYVANNCFSIGPIDLPRKVRLKKRKQKKTEKKDTKARTNRTYQNFQKVRRKLFVVQYSYRLRTLYSLSKL